MKRDPCRSRLRRRPPAVRPGLGAIIAFAAAISSPAQEGFKPLPSDLHLAENPLEIPLVGPGPLPVIETGIGDRGPIRLLLDTGANQLILFRPVVEALKLETRGVEQKIDLAFGGSLEALKAARIDSLHLVRNGDAVGRLRALDALVVGGGPGVPGVETHGVLGTAVLPSVLLRIDYPGRKLRLETGALPSPGGREVLALGKDLTIAARVGARPLRLMVDTGYDGGFLIPSGEAGRLRFRAAPIRQGTFTTPAGDVERRVARLEGEVRIGSHRFRDPVVDIVSGEHGALIGSGALRHFALTLDPAKRRARLERESREPIDSPPVVHPGFWIEKRKDGGWVVSRVDPEAPAARAGIAAGVEILGLPRVDAGDLSQRRLEEEARAAPEGKLLVHIRREGQTMLVRVPVQVLVE